MLSGPGELADLRVCVGLCADLPLQDSLGLLKAVVPVISLIMKSNILKISCEQFSSSQVWGVYFTSN